jgi:hypothetical protein
MSCHWGSMPHAAASRFSAATSGIVLLERPDVEAEAPFGR